MKKTHTKTIVREIKSNLGRFIAIFAIVALGTGFLSGLLATTPDMHASVDSYYDRNQMSDILIKATMGLTEEDLEIIASTDMVDQVMPSYVTDALMNAGNDEVLVTRINGLPSGSLTGNGAVNRLELLEGRWPQAKNECLAERSGNQLAEIALGTKLKISDENEDDVNDTYHSTEFTVVGIVGNPFYFSMERETSSTGNGRIDSVIYVDESNYALDVYTDFYITLAEAAELTAFTEEYENFVEGAVEKLEALGETRSAIRYDDIVSDARSELEKGRAEYEESRLKAERELADAQKEIEDGKIKIAEAEAKLSDAKKELSRGEARLDSERSDYEEQIRDNEEALHNGRTELEAARKSLSESKEQLDAVQKEIEQAKALQSSGIVLPDDVLAQIHQYDAGLEAYHLGMEQLTKKEAQIIEGFAQLEASKKEAEAGFSDAAAQLEKARREVTDGEVELLKHKKELAEGETEYLEAKTDAESELNKAEQELADAEKEILDLERPEWYVLDRNANVSYVSFSMNADKVAAIATVFPIFFLLIAALVALTTMTRMVEEERTQIGTLKALGYSRGTIMFKYLVYCGLASILGSAAGLLTGLRLLPSVLWTAYASMYHLPDFVTQFSFTYALFSAVPVILSTMVATYAACRQVMKENPATLMLPKAPKAGKRIFLERVRFLWSHMTFSQKATARNLLRYKKHFFMTVTGIAGCTALIVTGFGLRDSLVSITETQYNEIYHYDLMIGLKENSQADAQLNGFLQNKERVENWAGLFSSTGNVFYNNEIYTTTIYAPENAEEFAKMIQLRDRKSGSAIAFSHSSVIMTEKLAEVAGIDTGDTFTLENKDGDTAEFVLEGTTENYTGSFVYIGKDVYSRAFGDNFSRNALMVKTTISNASGQDSALTEILTFDAVSNASFVSQTKASFDNLLSSIDFIVIVLILAAGALAVIVLYNLTNININERRKELATLKVLGFHPEEVAGYIFRETTLLSIIGTLAGLLLGVLLHAFVIQTAESAEFMFGRSISPLSFLLSAAVTLFFSFVVDLLMYKKLKNIEMVDSMKAID